MISLVVFALGVYAVIVSSNSSPTVSNQNERIYIYDAGPYGILEQFKGYVKTSDMKPNTYGFFMYPSSYNSSQTWNAYQKFLLIRLPSWLGGDKNDLSAFRAYSMLDVESHCLIRYWPQEGRQVIQDSCHFEKYRTIDGASYFYALTFSDKPIENALPQLDLGTDNKGYLYVKPPTWTVDKNGVIGDGRHLSKAEILASSRMMLQDYENLTKSGIKIPLEYERGSVLLIDVIYGADQTLFYYVTENVTRNGFTINLKYCNCTKPSEENTDSYFLNKMQVWKLDDTLIYVFPVEVRQGIFYYKFQVYENGYQATLEYFESFDKGIKLTLDAFFNGTKLSDLEQIA